MLRFLSHILAALLSLVLIALFVLFYFIGTPSGLLAGFDLIKPWLPGTLSYRKVEGTLLKGFTMHRVRYIDSKKVSKNFAVVDNLKVRLDLHELLLGHLTIRNLTTDGLMVHWPSLSKESNEATSLPIKINLKSVTLNRSNFKIGAYQSLFKQLKLQGEISWQPLLHWKIGLQANGINTLATSGWHSNLNIDIQTQGMLRESQPSFDLNLKMLSGTWNQHKVSGYGHVDWLGKSFIVQPIQLHVGPNLLSIQGKGKTQQLQLDWRLQSPDLAQLYKQAKGTLYAKGTLSGSTNNPIITGEFHSKQFSFADDRLENFKATLNWQPNKPNRSQIKLSASRLSLSGTELKHIALRLTPAHNHTLRLTGGATLPDLNITVQPIQLNLKPRNGGIDVHGAINSGASPLQVDGRVVPLGTSALKFRGQNILVANTSQYEVYATPDVLFQWDTQRLNISGDVLIPKARIVPQYADTAISLPDDTVISQGPRSAEKRKASYALNTHIRLHFGDAVRLRYRMLTGRLEGAVVLTDTAEQPTHAKGELHLVEGKVAVLGKTLVISKGRLTFTGGPVTQPFVDVEATRALKTTHPVQTTSIFSENSAPHFNAGSASRDYDNITVGVRATGQLQRPKVVFFSRPVSLSRDDILAYLVLGRSVEQISQGDASLLLQAASLLNVGGSGVSNLTSKLKNILHVDSLGVESVSSFDQSKKSYVQGTAVALGKYLSPKFYLSYRYRISDQVNALTLRYKLSKKWTVQGFTSNDNSGVDLLYTIDR